ncbi:hypothetical protein OJAV_G00217690 [Oryzias javanicus]|uniref:Uncharacterized protein n=1 Tax=Oryzias javanicus TaxID=123683 RepID=A0A437C4W0_ORYJA|nr:hypothetical protein OJAV_G00217690 [Oryzias javanicus]
MFAVIINAADQLRPPGPPPFEGLLSAGARVLSIDPWAGACLRLSPRLASKYTGSISKLCRRRRPVHLLESGSPRSELKMRLSVQTAFLLLLFAGDVCLSVNVNWLTRVVDAVRREYKIEGQFCLAANIPLTTDEHKLEEILNKYKYSSILDDIETGEAFVGNDLVIAKVIKGDPIHAEAKVLTQKHLELLIENTNGNFLFIYSYLSACTKCTTPRKKFNVVDVLSKYVKSWTDSAFVFTKVFDRPKYGSVIPRTDLVDSICNLGDAMGRLKNIYRCDKMNNQMDCSSCSTNGKISEVCLDNDALPEEGGVSSCRRSSSSSDSDNNWRNRKSGTSSNINRSRSPKRKEKCLVGKHSHRTKSRNRSPVQERIRRRGSRG